nr:MAG TPA: hypothetical protein [Caudoviricetes sp.]
MILLGKFTLHCKTCKNLAVFAAFVYVFVFNN